MRRLVRWMVIGVLLTACQLAAVRSANAQIMNLVPRSAFGNYPQHFLDACLNMNQWPTVKSVANYLGSFADDLDQAPNGTLQTCFQNMQNNGLLLSIEVGAYAPVVNGCGTGADCFWKLKPQLDRVISLGAPGIRIRMDEPLTKGRAAGQNQNDIVNHTVIFIQLMRAYFPSVAITSIEAYPYNSASLLNWWMTAVRNASNTAGVAPPDEFELDHDPNILWSWNDIFSMRNHANSLGWGFAYIFCSQTTNPATDQIWHDQVIGRGNWWYTQGQVPNSFTFESWEQQRPSQTVPESNSLTFMGTVKDFRTLGYFPR
jgi:hypothetical protein